MAFYKDVDSKNKKKTNYAKRGSWADEGAHYNRGDRKADNSASQRRFGPGAEGSDATWGHRPPRRNDNSSFDNNRGEAGKGSGRQGYGRPAGSRPAGGRPNFDRPAGDRPAGDRPNYGRPAGARSDGDRPNYARPAGDRPTGDRPSFGRPGNARPTGDRPNYARPAGDRPSFGRPGNARPTGDRPAGDRPNYARPAGDRPAGDRPSYGRPAGDRPAYGRPANSRPAADRPGTRPMNARPAQAPAQPAYKQFEYTPQVVQAPVMGYTEEVTPNENLLSGRNPIREALKSGRDIEKLLVAKGELSGSAREIVMMAKEARILVQEVDRTRLDAITKNHQGMLAYASAYQYSQVEDMLAVAKERKEEPFIILLDGVTDPHNLGAVIRSAECAGAHGVIVPQRRSVGLTPAAVKASAGAIEHVKVARVVNLTRTMEDLQKEGLWFYAATMDGENYDKVDFTGPVGLVIGAEGEGISRLVEEKCDRKVSLPMKGQIESLNASVAAGILMYAVLRGRA